MANRIKCWFSLTLHGDGASTVSDIPLSRFALTSWAQSYDATPPAPQEVEVTCGGQPVTAVFVSGKVRITAPVFTGQKTFIIVLMYDV